MFELVPPKSKVVEYVSVYDKLTYTLKVFDFEEHNKFRSLLIECSEFDESGKLLSTNDEDYTIKVCQLGIDSISGVDGKFTASWDVIKEIARKIVSINEVVELEK